MSKEELRALYKEQLRADPEEGSKGAGLGFMEIARRASKPIEFDFTDLGDYTFFALKATIKGRNDARQSRHSGDSPHAFRALGFRRASSEDRGRALRM